MLCKVLCRRKHKDKLLERKENRVKNNNEIKFMYSYLLIPASQLSDMKQRLRVSSADAYRIKKYRKK